MRVLILLAVTIPMTSPSLADMSQFRTPSGNIGCEYQPDMNQRIYCVRLEPSAQFIELDANGARMGTYEGDFWFPDSAPVLAYNTKKDFGLITCTSLDSGLECWIRGKGFKANRAAIELFNQ
jgi:hypothetical protein